MVPVNMSDRVLLTTANHPPWTERMASHVTEIESPDTTVTLLYVFDSADKEATEQNLASDRKNLGADELANRKEDVIGAIDILDEAGYDYEVTSRVDDDRSEAILKTARDVDASRIYIYSSGRSPVGKVVFGSALLDVIRGAAVPVIVTPHNET